MSTTYPEFSFQPPPGGDVWLKSSEGVVFLAHSAVLGLASPVFRDMFSIATQRDIVELAEDAESISFMLRFLYPPPFFSKSLSLPLLEKSLHMAKKYNIDGIPLTLDYLLSHPSDKWAMVHLNPVCIFWVANSYGLRETQKVAARAMQSCHLRSTNQVKDFAAKVPSSASVIGLLGAPRVRIMALIELLIDFDLTPIAPELPDGGCEIMICAACYERQLPMPDGCYRPLWYYDWCLRAFNELALDPLDDCVEIFQVSILNHLGTITDGCKDCLNAARFAGNGRVFEKWLLGVRTMVREIFEDVEPLYAL
jgi:hypothetical protein